MIMWLLMGTKIKMTMVRTNNRVVISPSAEDATVNNFDTLVDSQCVVLLE